MRLKKFNTRSYIAHGRKNKIKWVIQNLKKACSHNPYVAMLPSVASACPAALSGRFGLSCKLGEEYFNGFAVSPDGTQAYVAEDDGIACFTIPKYAKDELFVATNNIRLGKTVLDLAAAPNGNVLALLASTETPESQVISVSEYTFQGDPVSHFMVVRRISSAAPGAIACDEGYVAVALCGNGEVSVQVFATDGTSGPRQWKAQMADLHGMAIRNGMLVLFGFATPIGLRDLLTGTEIGSLPTKDLISGSVFRSNHMVYADAASLLHFVEWPARMHLGFVKVPVEEWAVDREDSCSSDTETDFAEILDVACSRDHVFVRTLSNDVFVYQVNI
jgi:hypothetical protein